MAVAAPAQGSRAAGPRPALLWAIAVVGAAAIAVSVTPGRRASYQRRGASAVAAPAERRTRRRPWPAAAHVSAGAPIASAATSTPAPRRSSTAWKSPATCSASASS